MPYSFFSAAWSYFSTSLPSTACTLRICGSERSGPKGMEAFPAFTVTMPDIAGTANSFIMRSTSALETVGSRVAIGTATGPAFPVATCVRYACSTALTEPLTSRVLPALP